LYFFYFISDLRAQVPTNGLVAYYPFNGNANDESGNGIDGTVYGATLTEDICDSPNSAYEFDGINDYIELNNNFNEIDIPFTISCDFLADNDDAMLIFGSDLNESNSGEYYGFWLIKNEGNTINFGYGDGRFIGASYRRSCRSLEAMPSNEWVHVTVTVNGPTDMKMYVNGQGIETILSGTGLELVHNNLSAKIGYRFLNQASYFNGKIDDVIIYDRALSEEEIKLLYDSDCRDEETPIIPSKGVVAYYPFNGNANDEGINGIDGTANGASLTADRCDNENRAYLFDGINDNIFFGDVTDFDGLNTLSISAWIYTDGITDEHTGTIVSKYNANGDSERVFIFDLYPDNNLRFCMYGADGNGDYEWQRTSKPLPFSEWTHVVVTWDGRTNTIDLCVNGTEVDSYYGYLGNIPKTIYDKSSSLMIGCSEFGHHSLDYLFNGKIDDVIIYDRVLTKDEIAQLYFFDCLELKLHGEDLICQGESNKTYSILSEHGSIINYTWNYTGTGMTVTKNEGSIIADFSQNATSGYLSVLAEFSDGTAKRSEELYINVNPLPKDPGDITGDSEVCIGENFLNYSISNIEYAENYNWNYSGDGASIIGNSEDITINFSDKATSGDLSVYGDNACGNGDKTFLSIAVNSCEQVSSKLKIPNSFSPNGDNINELFIIEGLEENTSINIFNRNGKILYQSENYQNNWDGTDLNGIELSTGTYWYVLKIPGIPTTFNGFIYLKR
jgi:gliding motility-associated-like protein